MSNFAQNFQERRIHKIYLLMKTLYRTLVLFLMMFSLTANVSASNNGSSEEKELDLVPMILHHIADAHEFHLWGEGDESVSIPLPVILYTEGNLDIFMSSAFHHGHATVKKGDREYKLDDHGHIEELGGAHPFDISITKNVFTLLMSCIFLLLIFIPSANKYKKNGPVPSGLQSFLEPLILFVRDEIARPNIEEKKVAKFMPYLLSVFFFIWISNMIGLIPFFPFSANLTGNIAVTVVLAMITFIITTINGNKHYWGHIFNMPGVPKVMLLIMIPVEVLGMFTKPFALMIRLFANITAGHIIILSLVSLFFVFQTYFVAPIVVPFVLFMSVLELLVAFLQAFVFTMLSALFIGSAVADHH